MTGWFEGETFARWFKHMFLRRVIHLHAGNKVALIDDNLSSHFEDEVKALCRVHNISFICLPANSTHFAQPLDVAYFRPFKGLWRLILGQWRLTREGRKLKVLPEDKFPMLLKKLIDKVDVTGGKNLKSGFKACGIVPVSFDQIFKRAFTRHNADELAIDEAFKSFLAEQRAAMIGDGELIQRKWKKVVPGRAVTEEDLVCDPVPEKPKQKRAGRKKEVNEAENEVKVSDASNQLPFSASKAIASCSNAVDVSLNSSSSPASHQISIDDINEKDFVTVQYDFKVSKKTHTRMYVGMVRTKYVNRLQILFMRPYKNSVEKFVFQSKINDKEEEVEDVDTVKLNQIVMLLPKPLERRGIFTFPNPCY